jgi:methyl-accepting chemotaxis protein
MKMMQVFSERPWTRLLQVLAAIIIIIMSVVIILAILGEQIRMKLLVKHQGELLATTIQESMSESLATGDNEAVTAQFARLGESALDVEVFVFDSRGRVSFSTRAEDTGKNVDTLTESPAVVTAVGEILADRDQSRDRDRENSFTEEVHGSPHVTVVRPILNQPRCFACHESAQAVLGGILVRSSTERAATAIRTARNLNILVGIAGLVIAVLLMRSRLGRVVRNLLQDVVSGSEIMASSSAELSGVFQQLSTESQETTELSQVVADSVNQLTSTVVTLAATMEQSSAIAGTIAVATEQLTASVIEIAREAESAATLSREAVAESTMASQMIHELSTEAQEIETVTEIISSISEQINLLALNATIESARAGEAGRGFAVVANEIKQLARQTADATGVIHDKIDAIQGSTARIVSQVAGFAERIDTVNAAVTAIATSVEEQSTTTREITSSVTQSSDGFQQVTKDLTLIATGLHRIAEEMSEMSAVAGKVSGGSETIKQRAEELSSLAGRMTGLIARFRF